MDTASTLNAISGSAKSLSNSAQSVYKGLGTARGGQKFLALIIVILIVVLGIFFLVKKK